MDILKFAGIRNLDDIGNRVNRKEPEKVIPEDIGNRAPEVMSEQLPEDIGNRIEEEPVLPEDIGNRQPASKQEALDEIDNLINNINLKMNKNDLIKLKEEISPIVKNESILDNLTQTNPEEAENLYKILSRALSYEREYDPRYNPHVDSFMESIMKELRRMYNSVGSSLNKFKGKYASENEEENE
jgi:hypothetical protein